MADITVRKIRFAFDESWDLQASPEELATTLPALGLSLTMPYLEPYLIRTMKVAIKQIEDPGLAEDARRFSQQEGHHYRNHAVFNEQVRDHFGPETATSIRAIEKGLEADYQRFTREKSLRFNLAYAEGFEAMTCSGALALANQMGSGNTPMMPGGDLWAWHMVEEIEHRTVAFDVYHHLVGSYPYRILRGAWAQWHYLRYVMRFASCMAEALGTKLVRPRSAMHREALGRYLRTWSPRYDPAKIELPDGVEALLSHYSSLARQQSA